MASVILLESIFDLLIILIKARFPPFIISLHIPLHELYCFLINRALNLDCGVVVLEVPHEVKKFLESFSEILDRYLTIMIEVKAQPVVLNSDLYIIIIFPNIV